MVIGEVYRRSPGRFFGWGEVSDEIRETYVRRTPFLKSRLFTSCGKKISMKGAQNPFVAVI